MERVKSVLMVSFLVCVFISIMFSTSYAKTLPDLVVEDLRLNRDCQVVVKVKNNGRGMVPDEVWTVHKPESSGVFLHINGKRWGGASIWKFDAGKSLQRPGGTATYKSTLKVSGTAAIKATVDMTKQVKETNENNNSRREKLTCKAQSKLPDLVVSRIELTEQCKIKVTIKNQGKGGVPNKAYDPLHGVIIQATAGNAGWGGYHLSMIDPAKKLKRPGASVSYVGFKRALQAGENLTLKVAILDPNNTAKESNTKNNSKTVRLVCKKPGLSEAKVLEPRQIKPDLTVKMMKIEPANPTTEDTIKFSAFITNIGAVDAPQSKAGIRIGGETNPMVWDKPVITPQSSNAIVRLKRLTVPQNYRVTFIADVMDDVNESDENNNEKYLNFKVTESPPLQVVYPTNSQHFQILNNKIKITVRFNKSVNKDSVITKSSFRINMETDHNASGTIQWVNDSELI